MPVLDALQNTAVTAKDKATTSINEYIPPSRRSDIYNSVQTWCRDNPKLAIFIASHALLTTTPLLVFTFFALSSLGTCIVIALAVALSFCAFVIGCAALLLIPVVCFTTFVATCLWAWAVLGWWLLARFSERDGGATVPFASDQGDWDGVWKKGRTGEAEVNGPTAGVLNGDGEVGALADVGS